LSRPDFPSPRPPDAVDTPVFEAPWQAEAFALTVALHERGVFSWTEWTSALSSQVHAPDAAADGHDYYEHWVRALESLLAARGMASPDAVEALTAAWHRAAHVTPHGQPILLENDPLKDSMA
jgi:nitrile hydratase accessory protein